MFGCSFLQSVVFKLPVLYKIGDNFLGNCCLLTEIELTGIPLLQELGSMCLSNCPRLSEVKLDLPSLETVGKNFLSRCPLLTKIYGAIHVEVLHKGAFPDDD